MSLGATLTITLDEHTADALSQLAFARGQTREAVAAEAVAEIVMYGAAEGLAPLLLDEDFAEIHAGRAA
jgi:predicted transcriptional regulator